jgi:hypothetical protein
MSFLVWRASGLLLIPLYVQKGTDWSNSAVSLFLCGQVFDEYTAALKELGRLDSVSVGQLLHVRKHSFLLS